MSGIFWEPEKQPNICEAATGFTFSTINLLIAIPMVVLDIVCAVGANLASLARYVLAPLLEYAFMLAEMMGVQEVTTGLNCFLLFALLATVYQAVKLGGPKNGGSWSQVVSRLNLQVVAFILLANYLTYNGFGGRAVYPNLGYIYLGVQFASHAIMFVDKEYSKYAHDAPAHDFSNWFDITLHALKLESFAFLIITAFGFPSFSEQDSIEQYFWFVPTIAFQLRFVDFAKKHCMVQTTDINGEAQPVPEEKKADDKPAAGDAKADEAKAEDKAAEKSADAAVEKEVKTVVNKIQDMFASATGVLCCSLAKFWGLPWMKIFTFITWTASVFLTVSAWLKLTDNQLAWLLPAISLLVPKIVNQLEDKIPQPWRAFIMEWRIVCVMGIQCHLMAGSQ